jgi:hypothetical protein
MGAEVVMSLPAAHLPGAGIQPSAGSDPREAAQFPGSLPCSLTALPAASQKHGYPHLMQGNTNAPIQHRRTCDALRIAKVSPGTTLWGQTLP